MNTLQESPGNRLLPGSPGERAQHREILVAEDDSGSRELLIGLLTKWGYRVVGTSNGAEALAKFHGTGGPRLALIDWMMPEVDGLEVCRQIRARKLPIAPYLIMLTSMRAPEQVAQALDAGADDFIIKPFDGRELQARLRVGHRIVDLQAQVGQQERLQGVLQMAAAVCHELNQPLQAVLSAADLLLMDQSTASNELVTAIRDGVKRLGQVTRRIMNLMHCRTTPYMNGNMEIIDLDGQN